ncbi:hypothetical protein GCM10010909_00960 [Acidocella aquatica]|uniref:Transposase n=1 Tax=Acidocella aquatica TaxID=1922313 RepID=A0ABQ6A5D0_9PROT|nr:hypothetical protein GCM10010909_00960 [Acidocella aquatica]
MGDSIWLGALDVTNQTSDLAIANLRLRIWAQLAGRRRNGQNLERLMNTASAIDCCVE